MSFAFDLPPGLPLRPGFHGLSFQRVRPLFPHCSGWGSRSEPIFDAKPTLLARFSHSAEIMSEAMQVFPHHSVP